MQRFLAVLVSLEVVLLVAVAVLSATASLLSAAQDPGTRVLQYAINTCLLLLVVDLVLMVTVLAGQNLSRPTDQDRQNGGSEPS